MTWTQGLCAKLQYLFYIFYNSFKHFSLIPLKTCTIINEDQCICIIHTTLNLLFCLLDILQESVDKHNFSQVKLDQISEQVSKLFQYQTHYPVSQNYSRAQNLPTAFQAFHGSHAITDSIRARQIPPLPMSGQELFLFTSDFL